MSVRLAALLMSAAVATGCGLPGSTERPGADDEDRPAPSERPLEVESIVPESDTLSTRPTLYVEFNDYVEDDAFRIYDAGSLQSGALGWGGWTDYVMTDKTLIWTARSPLPSGLDVSFRLTDDLVSVTGSPLTENEALRTFRTVDRDPMPDPNPLPSSSWSDVRAIFEDHCTDCHGAEDWQLNPLTRDSLVGKPSDQVDRVLVRPYDPPDSYLMHKILWDYPDQHLSPQPPPWAGGEELPREDLLAIEQWIAAGAPGP